MCVHALELPFKLARTTMERDLCKKKKIEQATTAIEIKSLRNGNL